MAHSVQGMTIQGEHRFVIIDHAGTVVDDAQGYGYKTAHNAHKVIWYKFDGGRKKMGKRKSAARRFWREHPDIRKSAESWILGAAKDLCRGEITLKDIAASLSRETGTDVAVGHLQELDPQ